MSEMEGHDSEKNTSNSQNMLSLTSSEENHKESNFPDRLNKIFKNSFTADREKQNEEKMQRFVSQHHRRRCHSNKELFCYSASETKASNARHVSLIKEPCDEDLPNGNINLKPESDNKIRFCKKIDANECEAAVNSKLDESSAMMDHAVSYGNSDCTENQRGALTCNDVKWNPLPVNSDDLYLALSQAKKDMTCRFDMFMQKCHQLESDVENLSNEINRDVLTPQAEVKSVVGENTLIPCNEKVETDSDE